MNKVNIKKRIKQVVIITMLAWLIWFWNCLPKKSFGNSTSTVLLSQEGELLGARIADDGQWRFSSPDSIPFRFEQCLLEFEDKTFYKHFGVSPKGIGRAIKQNVSNKRVVSGGSTITMQVARLMRGNHSRNIFNKFIEINMAMRMELKYTKKEILNMYVSNAPFGNNVVGLEAASWRYFGRPSHQLSWAESATLAVLPNAPGLIYPGKNPNALLSKRNRLLNRLYHRHIIDQSTYKLALLEEIPGKPLRLPNLAPHLLERLIAEGRKGHTIKSTIKADLQLKMDDILSNRMRWLADNKIYNSSLLITETKTGKVIAYIGNATLDKDAGHAEKVDCIMAPRSTGSILKPILYAKAMENGLITPNALLYDVPSYFNGFSPKNFNYQYDGLVHADEALSRSLNIPFVRLLSDYGNVKFYNDLRKLGLSDLNQTASHYGLSLILGGAEAKLWDLNKAYTSMGQELLGIHNKAVRLDDKISISENQQQFSKACLYSTFEAMTNLNRPDENGNWQLFDEKKRIAWKTGTSFGFRDAWAIGITADYVVSVWVGNADGEGRPGLTGVKAAAPIMFDVFRQLPEKSPWFPKPLSDMSKIEICQTSGLRASVNCPIRHERLVPSSCLEAVSCHFHKPIFTDKSGKHRVNCDCESAFEIQKVNWFIIPPGVEKYYSVAHPEYVSIPPVRNDCREKVQDKSLNVLYPRQNTKINIPIEINGEKGSAVFEVAHRTQNMKLFWHIDNDFIGITTGIHQLKLSPGLGKHILLVMDENGVSQSVNFEVVN